MSGADAWPFFRGKEKEGGINNINKIRDKGGQQIPVEGGLL